MRARKFVKLILKKILSEAFSIPVADIKEMKNFEDELGIYDFQLEDLKPVLRQQLGIEVRKRELRDCDDLYDMTDLVLEKLYLSDNDEILSDGTVNRQLQNQDGSGGFSLKDLYYGAKLIGLVFGGGIFAGAGDRD